ncbi:hypothetical protein ACFL5Z_14380 [Planctomycetota bacterium]
MHARLADMLFSNGSMYFGADEILDSVGFFSSLIDDVCIYNRVRSPSQTIA